MPPVERDTSTTQSSDSIPSDSNPSELITHVLESLRDRIRQYVLWHGLLLAIIWVCAFFWVVLALDYGPVLLGLSEMSRPLRLVLLIVIAVVLGFILYGWVYRRVRKQLRPESLALLLERRFPSLNDALVTVVQDPEISNDEELAGFSADEIHVARQDHQRMLDEARQHAEQTLRQTSVQQVFNFRPLIVAATIAVLLTTSVTLFAINQRAAFTTALRRVYLLDDHQWPRDCHVELVGVKVKYAEPVAGIPAMNDPKIFSGDQVKVARLANISLLVRAEMPDDVSSNRRLPRVCEFIYRTADGQRGRLPMNKVGGARDGYQSYALEGEILERVPDDIRFYIRGDDHTIGPFDIFAVEPPVVVATEIDCDFPAYLIDEASARFTSRRVPYSAGMKLPIGTKALFRVQIDTLVGAAYILDSEGKLLEPSHWKDITCMVALNEIKEPVEFGLVIQGPDAVFMPTPLKFRIGAEEDKPPQITSRLQGIGTAVTPEARIPVVAEVADKHGVQRTWIELQTPLTDALTLEQPPTEGTLESAVDLRQLRIAGDIPSDLPTQPPGEIMLTVIAKDYCDLEGGENIGAGTQHPLEVVTADKLLRILEREEADQRFRLEQIYQEMTDARGYINRARSARTNLEAGFEPGDQSADDQARENSPEDWDLRQLFVQRALLQTQKSMQEIEGVAFTFDHIRLQLIHNRIDAEDRKQRLEKDVAMPLKQIANGSLPALEQLLNDADAILRLLTDPGKSDPDKDQLTQQIDEVSLQALTAADGVLSEIQAVLDSLLKFETQNELLDLVRRMLEQQADLKRRTEAMRNREAFDDIFDK